MDKLITVEEMLRSKSAQPTPADQEAVRAMMQRIKLSQQAAGAMKAQGDTGAMTMKAVARGTGIEYTALSKFTSGKRDFAADRVQRIHDYLEGVA